MHLIMIVKSATIFKTTTFLLKQHLYAVAAVVDGPYSSPLQTTMVDMHGGAAPFWWAPMEFEINDNSEGQTLAICVKCRRALLMGSDKSVGLLQLPVEELLRHYSQAGFSLPADIAVPIQSKSGKPRGVLYMSYTFGGAAPPQPQPQPAPSAPVLEEYEEYGWDCGAPVVAAVVPSAPYIENYIMLH